MPEGMGGSCTKLKWWLDGMGPAARAWEEDYCCHLEEAGMRERQQRSTMRRLELDAWFKATISHSLAREKTCSGSLNARSWKVEQTTTKKPRC